MAIGWVQSGDLTTLPDDRGGFKDRLRESYPDKSESWVANAAGQLLRFRHGMQPGDLIVYPQKSDRTVNVGQIGGDYAYEPDAWPDYPHRRVVEWIKVGLKRDSFSQGCLYELGAASVFTVNTHRDEVVAAVAGIAPHHAVISPPNRDKNPISSAEPDVERVTELTRDFILKTFQTSLKGHPFAEFCGSLLEGLGYRARVSPPGADQGVDIMATEDPLGVRRPVIKVQCKSGSGQVGSSDVQALNGTLAQDELGLFISVGGFSLPARQVATGMPRMRLLGPDDLVELLLDHYTQLPDEAKKQLPLRRVWMPNEQTVEE